MWLLPALLLLIVPGCFSMSGPWSVSGPRGGSATIQCRYDPGWESYSKWWCRGEAWGSCDTLLKTTGSEWKVQSGRVSIQDDHWRNRFTVTIEELRASDEDVYWCGIEKSGTDLGHQVRVYVGPALPVTTQLAVLETTHPPELETTHPPELETTDMTELTSPYPAVPVTTSAWVGLATSPPIAQSSNSSMALTRSLTRFLLCNLHVVLLTVIKVPLLGCLLCTLMWLSRSQGDPKGK
ncbi:CMRF35-like molecule 7 [Myotis myotis]|uniref:CD300 molecule like family member b n=1 Tax=Myotis myotis TaxID=51298 RepID=A0A7J7T3P3_MYOMY|nr:CMRF35-like molecule 7 [Myotis myotis]KAF6295292.1 CD300 molecule like family member b [Myotis myotis]